jgi:predicted amidophosphoribosyltransferase
MSDFEFEKKICKDCKEEKVKVLHFPLKGDYCRECWKKKARSYRLRTQGKSEEPWKRFRIVPDRSKWY